MSNDPNYKYRPDIDGLRAVAVWSVLGFHAFPTALPGGFAGVDIFFLISGYLISRIIFEGMATGDFKFNEFYSRRIKRILPSLTLVMSVTFLFGWLVLVADEMNELGLHVAAGAGFISNIVLWGEAGYFDTVSEMKPLLHLWSLAIEEQFYILFPAILWLGLKLKINLTFMILLVATGSFALNILMIDAKPTATFYSPLTRCWELLLGSTLAWMSLHTRDLHNTNAAYLIRNNHALSLIGLAMVICSIVILDKETAFPGWWALLPIAGAALLIAAGPSACVNRYVLSNRLMVWFGIISFPLYLWHWPLISFGYVVDGEQSKLGYRIFALLMSIFLAWLTVKLIENPVRRSSSHNATIVAALCVALALLGITGISTYKADLSESHTFATTMIERKAGHKVGESLKWYRGREDWLFLGNSSDNTVAKLRLARAPSEEEVTEIKKTFANVTDTATHYGITVSLMLAPNKSSIYPEYLPNEVSPSSHRYVDYFLNALRTVPALEVVDPTNALRTAKGSQGLLYPRTDTHWNKKGAFIAFAHTMRQLELPVPQVTFSEGDLYTGDLIGIGKLKNFPLHAGDNWKITWTKPNDWREVRRTDAKETSFGAPRTVINNIPLVDEKIWVIGDSFTAEISDYINATFREVVYVGHWRDHIEDLPNVISATKERPDRIIIIKVERSF